MHWFGRRDLLTSYEVEVSWSERQRFMPAHVEHKIIRLGASRNLVIRFPKPDMYVWNSEPWQPHHPPVFSPKSMDLCQVADYWGLQDS